MLAVNAAWANVPTIVQIQKKLIELKNASPDIVLAYLQSKLADAKRLYGTHDAKIAPYLDLLSDAAFDRKMYDLAEVALREQISVLQTGKNSLKSLAIANDGLSVVLAQANKLQDSENVAANNLQLMALVYGAKSSQMAQALSRYGDLLVSLGRVQEALASIRRSLAIFATLPKTAQNGRFQALNAAANLNYRLKHYDEALALYLAINTEVQKDKKAEVGGKIAALQNVTQTLVKLNQFENAIPYDQQRLSLAETLSDKMPAAQASADLAVVFNNSGNATGSATALQHALTLWSSIDGSDDAGFLDTEDELVRALLRTEQRELILPVLLEKVQKIRPAKEQHLNRFQIALSRVGLQFHTLKQSEKASAYEREALEIARLLKDPARILEALENAVNVLSAPYVAEAVPLLEELITAYSNSAGQSQENLLKTQVNLANAYVSAKQPDNALRLAQSVLQGTQSALSLDDRVSLMTSMSDAFESDNRLNELDAQENAILALAARASAEKSDDVALYILRKYKRSFANDDFVRTGVLADKAIAAYAGLKTPHDAQNYFYARLYKLRAQVQTSELDGKFEAYSAERAMFATALAGDKTLLSETLNVWGYGQLEFSRKQRAVHKSEQALLASNSTIEGLKTAGISGTDLTRGLLFERGTILADLHRYEEAKVTLDLYLTEALATGDPKTIAEAKAETALVLYLDAAYGDSSIALINQAIEFFGQNQAKYKTTFLTYRVRRLAIFAKYHTKVEIPQLLGTLESIRAEFSLNSWQSFSAANSTARLAEWQGDLKTAEHLWRELLALIPPEDLARAAKYDYVYTNLSLLLTASNRNSETISLTTNMLEQLQAKGRAETAFAADLLDLRAVALSQSNMPDAAETDMQQAISILESLSVPDEDSLAEALRSYANLRINFVSPEDLSPIRRRILALKQRTSAPNSAGVIYALAALADNQARLGDVLFKRNETDLALKAHAESLELFTLAEKKAALSGNLVNLTQIVIDNVSEFENIGANLEAETASSRNLVNTDNKTPEQLAQLLILRGVAIRQQSRPQEGLDDMKRALSVLRARPAVRDVDLRNILVSNSGYSYLDGYRSDALIFGREAILVTAELRASRNAQKNQAQGDRLVKDGTSAYRTVISAAWDLAHGLPEVPPKLLPHPISIPFKP